MYAIDTDHDYLTKIQSSMFLDNSGVTSISPQKANTIEAATENQLKSLAWKEEIKKPDAVVYIWPCPEVGFCVSERKHC